MKESKETVSVVYKCFGFILVYILAIFLFNLAFGFVYGLVVGVSGGDVETIPFIYTAIMTAIVPILAILYLMNKNFSPKAKRTVAQNDIPKLKSAVVWTFIGTAIVSFVIDFFFVKASADFTTNQSWILLGICLVVATINFVIIKTKMNDYQ